MVGSCDVIACGNRGPRTDEDGARATYPPDESHRRSRLHRKMLRRKAVDDVEHLFLIGCMYEPRSVAKDVLEDLSSSAVVPSLEELGNAFEQRAIGGNDGDPRIRIVLRLCQQLACN